MFVHIFEEDSYRRYPSHWRRRVERRKTITIYEDSYIGELSSLEEVLSFASLLRLPQTHTLLENVKGDIRIGDFGHEYTGLKNFDFLENYNSFFFIGFEPRFESSLLNICLARLKENNNATVYSYNSIFQNFFVTNQRGTSLKNLITLSEGRFPRLFENRFIKRSFIMGGFFTGIKDPLFFRYLSRKFFTFNKFLTNQMHLLNFLEIVGSNHLSSLYLQDVKSWVSRKSVYLSGWFLNSSISRVSKKSQRYSYFDIFEISAHDDKNFDQLHNTNGVRTQFPGSSFFEDDNLVLSIFGKLDESEKSSSRYDSSVFGAKDWILVCSFSDLENDILFKNFLYSKSKKSNSARLGFWNFFQEHKHKVFSKAELTEFFNLESLYISNNQTFLHSYKTMNFIQAKSLLIKNSNIFPSVINFYTNNKVLKYSPTMLNLSYVYNGELFFN